MLRSTDCYNNIYAFLKLALDVVTLNLTSLLITRELFFIPVKY